MSKIRLDESEADYLPSFPYFSGGLKFVKQRLNAYRPPIHQRYFWVVQGFVVFIAVTHSIVEHPGLLHDLGVPQFIPTTLYLVPVVYAAINFGFNGAIATALWATVLTVPNWVLWHEGVERFACISQMLVVNTMAFFIGQQVERVKSAQQQAKTTDAALRASEVKYRGLFESSPIAILVLDGSGTILDANPAAGTLFNRVPEALKSMAIADLIGTVDLQQLRVSSGNSSPPGSLVLKQTDGLELYLDLTLTEADDGQGNFTTQVLFRDVTEERLRQAGLRAYAAHVIHVQEEERQRIARELHDGIVQQLVLLYRQLSSLQDPNNSLPSSLAGVLREARETAEEVVKELRDFTKALRPPILDDLGLVVSVRRLLSDLAQRTASNGQMKVVGKDRRLPPDTELGMFRITQEALRNVERHAKATHLAVTITFTEHKVRLDVQDDGMGFTVPLVPVDFTASGHLGLISMQERANLLKGKVEVQSSPGNGTCVTVSVPI